MAERAFQVDRSDNTNGVLIRVMALHALAYCPRLFYLEEVEHIRVADRRVFEGRRWFCTASVR